MKEAYFTPENIDTISGKIVDDAGKYTRPDDMSISGKPVLLVVDMQNYFIDSISHAFIPSSTAIIPRINELISSFTLANIPVIYTRHYNDEANAGQMAVKWKRLLRKDSDDFEISPVVKIGREIVDKTQYDAFYESRLEVLLKSLNTDTLVVCGLAANLCCETTVRSAFVRGYNVIFPVDTTASFTYELHRSSYIGLSHGFINPVQFREVMEMIGAGKWTK